ncbi:MAG: hypothetical protein RLZZ427_807, partial [Pseudomonadota bacterium]
GNLVSGEGLTVSASGTFASANAGTQSITASYTLGNGSGGGKASNYTLAAPTGLSAVISRLTVTIAGLKALDKVYDGTTQATISGTPSVAAAVLSGDQVAISGTAQGTFASAAVGNNKAVTVDLSTLSLSGRDGGNYVIGGLAQALTASITEAPSTTPPAPVVPVVSQYVVTVPAVPRFEQVSSAPVATTPTASTTSVAAPEPIGTAAAVPSASTDSFIQPIPGWINDGSPVPVPAPAAVDPQPDDRKRP